MIVSKQRAYDSERKLEQSVSEYLMATDPKTIGTDEKQAYNQLTALLESTKQNTPSKENYNSRLFHSKKEFIDPVYFLIQAFSSTPSIRKIALVANEAIAAYNEGILHVFNTKEHILKIGGEIHKMETNIRNITPPFDEFIKTLPKDKE